MLRVRRSVRARSACPARTVRRAHVFGVCFAQLVLLSFLPAAVRNPLKHVISKLDLPYAGQIGAAIGIALLAGNLPFITDTSDASGW